MSALKTLFEYRSPLQKYVLLCSPAPPPTPDYAGAAREQGKANIDAARVQSKLNNPNVVTPWGTQTVTYGNFDKAGYDAAMAKYNQDEADYANKVNGIGRRAARQFRKPAMPTEAMFTTGADQATIKQALSPDQQKLLDTGNQAKIGLSELALQGTGIARDVLGNRMDFSQLPGRPGSAEDTRTKVMNAMMARVNEDVDRQQNLKHAELLAAGIAPSSKAYQDSMALSERARTDARNQALLASGQEMTRDFQTDSNRRRDALAEMLTERQTPLNEITALQSGSQVNNPFSTPGYAQNSSVAAAPIFAARNAAADYDTDIYNMKAMQAGNLQQGLFGMGQAGLMAYGMSDRRLKSNIVRVGEHPVGVGLYEYDIFGRRERGVMAQELKRVKPEAVLTLPNGYLAVRYDLIGGRDGSSMVGVR